MKRFVTVYLLVLLILPACTEKDLTVHVTNISLDKANISLTLGETQRLIATVLPTDATNKTISWSSTNTAVVSVSGGLVTATGSGQAQIIATAEDGGITARCIVSVNTPVTSISLDHKEISLVEGNEIQLHATVDPENADNKSITWSSENTTVASVGSNGLVKALSVGSTNIIAQAESQKASCKVTVTPKILVTSISFVQPSLYLVEGDTLTVEIRILPENATNKNISWSTSDSSIATIDENGKVTAKKEGAIELLAKSVDGGDASETCSLTVLSHQNVVTYTSLSGSPIYPKLPSDVTVLNNTYENGVGRLIVKEKITKIWNSAFANNPDLERISIPMGVISLDAGAFFNCTFLTKIDIPETVKEIGQGCFEQCTSLKKIILPEGITEINKYTFYVCKNLESVTLPSSLIRIGNDAFGACSNLSDITLPDNLEIIEKSAFGNTGIIEVHFGNKIKKIGEGAFCYCRKLKSFTGKYASDNGRCLICNDTLLAVAPAGLTSYSIPDGVKIIGGWSFSGAPLYSIEIPNTVTTIESGAFASSEINQITISNSVTAIKESAFSSCKNLSKLVIPDSVTYLEGAFSGSGITEITLPQNIESMDGVLSQMWSLKTVSIPNKVKSITMRTFYQCYNLESIIFEKGSQLITILQGGNNSYNLELNKLSIFDASECKSLESIGSNSFYGLRAIKYVFGTTIPPKCEPNAFYKIHANSILMVPQESIEAYRSSYGWTVFSNIQAME